MEKVKTLAPDAVPVIDISPLIAGTGDLYELAGEINRACRENGFFYIKNHGVSEELQTEMEGLSKAFFAQPEEKKMQIRMELGGRAWRGYFPVKGELTSGKPDLKEGLYFGSELADDHPKVKAGVPMHGRNLFPDGMPHFQAVVLEYMDCLTALGHQLMEGISLSLGLEKGYIKAHFTTDPLTLFRIFHYPPETGQTVQESPWGVGEHTDYGVLTILKQDAAGGLQVKSGTDWIEAPPIAGTFVCNIGDMLDRMTGGLYRSTPHRVRNLSGRGRLSYPFFFDPNFDVEINRLPTADAVGGLEKVENRWDQADVHSFSGRYGDYVLDKVAKVFPELKKKS